MLEQTLPQYCWCLSVSKVSLPRLFHLNESAEGQIWYYSQTLWDTLYLNLISFFSFSSSFFFLEGSFLSLWKKNTPSLTKENKRCILYLHIKSHQVFSRVTVENYTCVSNNNLSMKPAVYFPLFSCQVFTKFPDNTKESWYWTTATYCVPGRPNKNIRWTCVWCWCTSWLQMKWDRKRAQGTCRVANWNDATAALCTLELKCRVDVPLNSCLLHSVTQHQKQ